MILKNGMLLINNELVKKDIQIENGTITLINDNINGVDVLDLNNLFVSPGFVDVHVHLREPGFSFKETIKNGTMAAARGGYTHVMAMPNLNPVPSTLEGLKVQLDLIKKNAVVRVTPYGALSKDLKGYTLADIEELSTLVCGYTDDGLGLQSDELMYEAQKRIKKLGMIVAAHCEDERFIESNNRRAEYEQVRRDIELVRITNVKYHICHISTKESVEAVRQAKKEGLPVTCEVAPHHLLLNETQVYNNPNFKMNPPLRPLSDVAACIEGLLDGTIDMIATDHAPHTEEEKAREFDKAPNGIVGLETAFGLLYKNLVLTNMITLERLVELMSTNPCKVFNIQGGEIKEGAVADLTVIDLNEQSEVNPKDFISLGKNTPFTNMEVQGKVKYTIVNGVVVYKNEEEESWIEN